MAFLSGRGGAVFWEKSRNAIYMCFPTVKSVQPLTNRRKNDMMREKKIKRNGRRSYRMSDRQDGRGVSGSCWTVERTVVRGTGKGPEERGNAHIC